jgi:hypothetical protein
MDIWIRAARLDTSVSFGVEQLRSFWGRNNRSLILCAGEGYRIKNGQIGLGSKMGLEQHYRRLVEGICENTRTV